MVGVFRRKNPGNALLLVAYGLVLKLGLMLDSPPLTRLEEDHYLYLLLAGGLERLDLPPLFYGILAFLILLIQAFLLNRIANHQRLLTRHTYLPGMCFLLITSLFPEWNHFSAPLLVNTLLMFVYQRSVQLYHTQSPMAGTFHIGLLLGLATLLYQPSLIHLLLIPFILFIMRPFRIREWLIALLGVTAPYYFMALEPLFTDRWNWSYLLPAVRFDIPAMPSSLAATLAISLLVIPFIVGGFYIQTNLNKVLIQIRKAWSILLLMLVVSLFTVLADGSPGYTNWAFFALPLAGFHAAAYYYPERLLIPRLIHWISFVFALYLVYAPWFR